MKQFLPEFIKRGLLAASGGPVILAIIYGILGASGTVVTLTPVEACIGILSITVMAFVAAGITAIYQIEQLPLISAIALHCGVLYLDYLLIYLVNEWIPRNWIALGVFTACFAIGFAMVWLCIYFVIRRKTERLNRQLPK